METSNEFIMDEGKKIMEEVIEKAFKGKKKLIEYQGNIDFIANVLYHHRNIG